MKKSSKKTSFSQKSKTLSLISEISEILRIRDSKPICTGNVPYPRKRKPKQANREGYINIKNIKKARKTLVLHALIFLTSACGGERGIRTPGPITVGSFQDCCNQPLCHFSGAKIILFLVFQVLFKKLP